MFGEGNFLIKNNPKIANRCRKDKVIEVSRYSRMIYFFSCGKHPALKFRLGITVLTMIGRHPFASKRLKMIRLHCNYCSQSIGRRTMQDKHKYHQRRADSKHHRRPGQLQY